MKAATSAVADSLERIEALAAKLGQSRIALIYLGGGPIAVGKIAAAFVAGVVTLSEAREMIAEARLTAPTLSRPQSRVPPERVASG